MSLRVTWGGKCFLGLTACVFPVFLNETKCLSGWKIQRNCISLKVERAGIRASPPPQSTASDLAVKKLCLQRELKPARREKPPQQQGIAACMQMLAQKQVLLRV